MVTPRILDALLADGRLPPMLAVFADGIERDFVAFDRGRRVAVAPAARTLTFVVA